MKTDKLTVNQLLTSIPADYLDALADQTQADLYQKKLPAKDLFYLLLYSLFDATPLSWRVLEEHFKGALFQHRFQPLATHIDHSSLGERLEKMPLAYFDTLAQYCFSRFAQYYPPQEHKRFHLIRFDSTTVSLSAKLLTSGMKSAGCPSPSKPPKQAIKYSIGFNGSFVVKANAYFENTYHNENVALAQLIHQTDFGPTDVAIFDRGLNGKKHLARLSLADIRFVTRRSPTCPVVRCNSLHFSTVVGSQDATVEVLEDTLITCFSERAKPVDAPFRLVVCRQKSGGVLLYFLTNMMDVSALEIAQIYHLRWQIEVFFKFLKQHLCLTHLLSRKAHSLQIMLSMSLIAASLIYLYRKINQIESFKLAKMRFLSELQLELLRIIWEKGYSRELFSIDNLAGP